MKTATLLTLSVLLKSATANNSKVSYQLKTPFSMLNHHLQAYNLFTSRLADFYILNDNGYI
jgi:hypothetical protein